MTGTQTDFMALSCFDQNQHMIAATVEMRLDACRMMVAACNESGHPNNLDLFVKGAKLHKDAKTIADRLTHR